MGELPKTHKGCPYVRLREMQKGDTAVTRVARRDAIGRVNADRQTQRHVEVQNHRAHALSRACELARPNHLVFLYKLVGLSPRIQINGQNAAD